MKVFVAGHSGSHLLPLHKCALGVRVELQNDALQSFSPRHGSSVLFDQEEQKPLCK